MKCSVQEAKNAASLSILSARKTRKRAAILAASLLFVLAASVLPAAAARYIGCYYGYRFRDYAG
jgi:hypothetical protein